VADAHPEIFAGYPVLTPPSSTHDPVTLAMALISLSLQQNTGDYVPTIDALVQRFADTFLKERWNQVRPKLVATLG
jgi:hypothetical protein